MATVVIPPFDAKPWPSLGDQVCDFLDARAVFGPGDRRGDPYTCDPEVRALFARAYEVFPKGHPQAGKRRFKRVALSMRKGSRKTELMAMFAFAELHPEAPVRCDGFDSRGRPVGRPVRDPYVPLVAYTEEQTEELAYGALYVIVTEGPDADMFDAGLERIMRADGEGRAVALAGAPNARDGARTTFQGFDETHRMVLPRLVKAHQTMLANIPKRPASDPWSLETTTSYEPGEGSVAENTATYAQQVREGKVSDPRLFWFHRQADVPLAEVVDDDEAVRAWIAEASGPVVGGWSDFDGIISLLRDPTTDQSYAERVWGNRAVAGSSKAFDAAAWASKAMPAFVPPPGDLIVIGFDGARFDDATALIATHVSSGFQWPLGIWERPVIGEEWSVPEDEVDEALDEAMDRYEVWRVYADPPYWMDTVRAWRGRYGEKVVIEWWTNRRRPMAFAVRNYAQAIKGRESQLSHDGDDDFARHIASAYRRPTLIRDDDTGQRLYLIGKERPDSDRKMDAAMAGCLSWEARGDAIAAGVTRRRRGRARGFA